MQTYTIISQNPLFRYTKCVFLMPFAKKCCISVKLYIYLITCQAITRGAKIEWGLVVLIALLNKVDPAHVESVKAEMIVLGTPKIKAVWMECFGHWAALEGSHRVTAAFELGLVPKIEEVDYSESVTLEDLGCDDSGDCATVSGICDDSYRSPIVKFEI